MTHDERRAHLKTILDSYDAALAAYQTARWQATLDEANATIQGMFATLKGMQALERAQAEAIAALRKANEVALAMFNDEEPQ